MKLTKNTVNTIRATLYSDVINIENLIQYPVREWFRDQNWDIGKFTYTITRNMNMIEQAAYYYNLLTNEIDRRLPFLMQFIVAQTIDTDTPIIRAT